MLILGVEPRITAYKTIVITVSLYEHWLLVSFLICCCHDTITYYSTNMSLSSFLENIV